MRSKTFDQAFNELIVSSQLHTKATVASMDDVYNAHKAMLKEKNRQIRRLAELAQGKYCPFNAVGSLQCKSYKTCVACIRAYVRRKR